MSDPARTIIHPLVSGEARIYTLDSGDSVVIRESTRRILASLLSIQTRDVELFDTPKGKPLLRNDPGLHFSISHSRDVSMIAVTRVAAVGVDIEQLRAVPNAETILRRFFTHEEIGTILSDDNRDLRFIEAWTRAEARVKVRGASVWEAATSDPNTTVRQITAPDGFVAAVGVADPDWTTSQYNISVADLVTR